MNIEGNDSDFTFIFGGKYLGLVETIPCPRRTACQRPIVVPDRYLNFFEKHFMRNEPVFYVVIPRNEYWAGETTPCRHRSSGT